MYPVSTAFQEAIRQPQRKTRISIMLIVWYPYAVYEFGDEAVISDSLTIADQFSGGKFCFGSVYSRNLSVQIDANKVPDLDPINVNLTDAVISATFYLTLPSGEEEAVFLGRFFADGNMTKRKKSILSVYASDSLMKLDLPVSEQNNKSVYDIAHDILWGDASQNLKNSKSEIEELPNGTEMLVLGSGQIQNVRDALMWIGDLTGTFIREDRSGGIASVEFVQIPTKYTRGGTAWNFDLDAFKADNGSIIPANVRFNTDFTDTSIRPITYLTRRNGTAFVSVNDSWTAAPDTLFGSYEFDTNPLLAAKTDEQMQTIMDNIRNYADNLRFCPFSVKFNGNPAIQCGDYVYLEPGGGIDETQYRHYGIVTYYKWKYRGASEIRCATDIAGERPSSGYEETQGISVMSAEPRATAETEQYPLKAKSQLEKRIDGIGGDPEKITGKQLPGATLGFEGMCKLIGKIMTGTGDGTKVIEADFLNNEYTFTRSFDQDSKVKIRHLQGGIVEITVSDQSSSATFLLYSNGAISTPHFQIRKDSGGEFKGYINNREILTK